nr:immunoglobulin light chain junction region [Macaca mulatta]MPO08995.1 immunoglobulin light chain junction region [Macaca mulatta]
CSAWDNSLSTRLF